MTIICCNKDLLLQIAKFGTQLIEFTCVPWMHVFPTWRVQDAFHASRVPICGLTIILNLHVIYPSKQPLETPLLSIYLSYDMYNNVCNLYIYFSLQCISPILSDYLHIVSYVIFYHIRQVWLLWLYTCQIPLSKFANSNLT